MQTLEGFKAISSALKNKPRGIEELTELREFMDNIPTQLESLAVGIKTALRTFDTLEGFKYRVGREGPRKLMANSRASRIYGESGRETAFSYLSVFSSEQLLVEDFNLRWRLFASPLETLELANEVNAALVKERTRFLEDMLAQQVRPCAASTARTIGDRSVCFSKKLLSGGVLSQAEFSATVDDLADLVSGFAFFVDDSKLAEVNESVGALGERIECSIQQAKTFNHREVLFGKDTTDYSRLFKIQKASPSPTSNTRDSRGFGCRRHEETFSRSLLLSGVRALPRSLAHRLRLERAQGLRVLGSL